MTRRVALREIAHARAGDKGNRSNVAVFVYDRRHYPAVKSQLAPARLHAEFGNLMRGSSGAITWIISAPSISSWTRRSRVGSTNP